MSLEHGSRLGPYEIASPLGAGGMGEVYRARDTRLNRTVAIKVLARHSAANPDARERFEREARAIAALNHPNICVLYDIGRQDDVEYLVMEYLEGETLADRLVKGPLPIDQVLRYAVEIADALHKAHRSGITHRDLKPGNIMLTKSGAKLLDFGLAKLVEETPAAPSSLTSLATLERKPATAAGTILGTFNYMAPEQIEAKQIDARTDIFAFGLVVYEMATGKKAFEGATAASVMAKILETEPAPMSSLQPMTPVGLDRIVKTCLAKDPDDRWQSAGDLRRELKYVAGTSASSEAAASTTTPVASASRPATARVAWLPWTLAGVSLAAVLAIAAVHFTAKPPAPPPALEFDVRLPDRVQFTKSAALILSPDGRTVAFTAIGTDAQPHIWVKGLDGADAHPLVNTDVGVNTPPPFWSPDSKFIVFSGFNKVRKVNVITGTAEDLCDKPGPVVGGSWNHNGVIIFGSNNAGLWKTSASGGKAVAVTTLNPAWHEREHELPQFLPDGRHFIYLRMSDSTERSGLYVGSLDDPPDHQSETRLVDTKFGASLVSAADGSLHVLTFRDGVLRSQRFDAKALRVSGEPSTIAEKVGAAYETPQFGANPNVIVYRPASPPDHFQLTWMDDSGKRVGTVGESFEDIASPVLSPDGTRVVMARGTSSISDRDIWVIDVARGTSLRLTAAGGDNVYPFWSVDGHDIFFASNRGGQIYNLYRKPADGARPEEMFLKVDQRNVRGSSWTPDGQFLILDEQLEVPSNTPGSNTRLYIAGVRDRTPVALPTSNFDETAARVSPDGHWLAYASMESGRNEVYVREFVSGASPTTGAKSVVSKDGGYWPMWRKDSKALAFVAADQTTVMIVDVEPGRTFQAGTPRVLFRLPGDRYRAGNTGWVAIAHTSDLKRFLVPVPVEETVSPSFRVLVNWRR